MKKAIALAKRILLNYNYFTYVFLFFMMSISIPLVHQYTGGYAKLTLIWAAVLAIYDLRNKRFAHAKYSSVLLMFIVFYTITILINYQYKLYENIVYYLYSIILLLIIFPSYVGKERNEIKKDIIKFSNIFCLFTFIAAVASIVMFIMQYWKKDGNYTIGFYLGRLWGVYVSPNAGGVYSIISMALTIILLLLLGETHGRIWIKSSYILNLLVQMMYLSLADSKGSTLMLISLILVSSFLLLYLRNGNIQKVKRYQKIIICMVVTVSLVLLVGVALPTSLGKAMSYVPLTLQSMRNELRVRFFETENKLKQTGIETKQTKVVSNQQEKPTYKIVPVEIERRYKDPEFGSGRVNIWLTGLKILRRHPLFGVGQANIYDRACEIQKNAIPQMKAGMHNIFMQIAVSNGLLGFSSFIIFAVLIARMLINSLFRCKGSNRDFTLFILIFALLTSLVINNLVEGTIFMCQSGISVVFWLFLGYSVVLSEKPFYEKA